MDAFTRALAGTLMALVIALGGLSFLCAVPLANAPLSQALRSFGTSTERATLNAALDASGVEGAAEDALRDNAAGIASATDMSEQDIDRAVDELDIPT